MLKVDIKRVDRAISDPSTPTLKRKLLIELLTLHLGLFEDICAYYQGHDDFKTWSDTLHRIAWLHDLANQDLTDAEILAAYLGYSANADGGE